MTPRVRSLLVTWLSFGVLQLGLGAPPPPAANGTEQAAATAEEHYRPASPIDGERVHPASHTDQRLSGMPFAPAAIIRVTLVRSAATTPRVDAAASPADALAHLPPSRAPPALG